MTRFQAGYRSYDTYTVRAHNEGNAGNLHYFMGGHVEDSEYTDYGTDDSWLNMIDDPEYRKTGLYLGTTLFIHEPSDHKVSLFVNHKTHGGIPAVRTVIMTMNIP